MKIINLQEYPFILDHRLSQHAIIPATWYLQTILSQSLNKYELPISLEDLHYLKAISIELDTDFLAEVRLDNDQCCIYINVNEEWEICASAQIQPTPKIPLSVFSVKDTCARCLLNYSKKDYYQSLTLLNYEFGPLHQGVDEIHIGKNEAIGEVSFLSDLESSDYVIHPAFLDACSHVGLSLLPPMGKEDVFITTSQERFTLFHNFPNKIWSYAKKTKGDQNSVILDFKIFDENNKLLAEIIGYKLQRISLSTLITNVNHSIYYHVAWEEASLSKGHQNLPSLKKILLDQANNQIALPKISEPTNTAVVIFLKNDQAIYENNLDSLNCLLTISKELYDQKIIELYRFIVIIEQETPLSIGQENIYLKNACIPSFCRTIKQEFPDWHVTCLDVGARKKEEILALVDIELSQPYEDDYIAYQMTNRYIGRLQSIKDSIKALPNQYKLSYSKETTLQQTQWIEVQSTPTLKEHDVKINVIASSINFRDVLILLNQYPEKDACPGIDGSGIISQVGHGVKTLKPGDEVIFIGQHEFSNVIILPECNVIKKPSHLHLVAAGSIPVVFITAFYALISLGTLRKNQSVLIHSAAGGVGTAAILIAKKLGATIHATAHPSKWPHLYKLGVSMCYSTRTFEFAETIPTQSIDLILNNLIGQYIPLSLSLLKKNGVFIEIGNKEIWSLEKIHSERPDVTYKPLHVLNEQVEHPTQFHHVFLQMRDFIEKHQLKIPSLKVYLPKDIQLAFRDMMNAKHIGKLVIAHEHSTTPSIKTNVSYLITGGLGGIGRSIMDYLLEQGAEHVYLLSRHPPKTLPQDKRVIVLTGDVGNEKDVERILNEINHSDFPLKGIFHAAGISDDAIIPSLNLKQIESVLQAKLLGAWHLHLHTESMSLDHFVLFSSVVSLLGTPGLANYAAANGFLDQLAYYRHFIGLAALSINWGPWEVGMLQKRGKEVTQSWLHQGFSIMDTKTALHHFDKVLQSKAHQIAIMTVNWNKLYSFYAQEATPSLLAELTKNTSHELLPLSSDSKFLNSLKATDDPDKTQILIKYLQQEVEALTGNKVTNFGLSFTELGITSLTAIEMTQNIGSTLGLPLPQTLLFNYTRIPILAEYLLIDKLHLKQKPQNIVEEEQNNTQINTKDMNNLSENEVSDLLDDALKDIDEFL